MLFVEFDLSGAEWVVVAYLSQDADMLRVVEEGKSPHVVTGALISGAPEEFVIREHKLVGSMSDPTAIANVRRELGAIPPEVFLPRSMSIRQAGKKSNHGLNYGMKYRRFALENEMLEADAHPIVQAYTTQAYPGIPRWWASIREELRKNRRTLTNCFGRRAQLLGEWGDPLFNAAYSFKPQSTVVDVCNMGMIKCYQDESLDFELGAEVHDSLLLMFPTPKCHENWQLLARDVHRVRKHMQTPIVYNDRVFVLGVDAKLGINWGDMHEFKLLDDLDRQVDVMQSAFDAASKRGAPSLEELLAAEEAEREWENTSQENSSVQDQLAG